MREGNDVVNVDVVHPPGINGDVENQLSYVSRGDVVIKESKRGKEWLVRAKQIVWGLARPCGGLHLPGRKLFLNKHPICTDTAFPQSLIRAT